MEKEILLPWWRSWQYYVSKRCKHRIVWFFRAHCCNDLLQVFYVICRVVEDIFESYICREYIALVLFHLFLKLIHWGILAQLEYQIILLRISACFIKASVILSVLSKVLNLHGVHSFGKCWVLSVLQTLSIKNELGMPHPQGKSSSKLLVTSMIVIHPDVKVIGNILNAHLNLQGTVKVKV